MMYCSIRTHAEANFAKLPDFDVDPIKKLRLECISTLVVSKNKSKGGSAVLSCKFPVVELNQIACLGDQKYPSFELRLILKYLGEKGHQQWCEMLMVQLELDEDGLAESFITAHQALEGLDAVVENFYRPGFGHEIASTFTLKELGAIGTCMLRAQNLAEALSIANSYYDLIGSFTDLVNIADENTFTQRQVDVAKLNPHIMRFLFELTVSGTAAFAKELSGKHVPPKSVHFSSPLSPTEKKLYQDIYQTEVFDNAKFNEWVVDISFLFLPVHVPIPKAKVSEHDLRFLLEGLRQDESLVDDINCILKGSPGDFPDPEMISNALGITSRTLRRRLSKVGTSYRVLIDKVRCQLAINLIQQGQMSNESLALELGYSDAPNFYKAFKKWTGNSPAYYRMTDE